MITRLVLKYIGAQTLPCFLFKFFDVSFFIV